MRCGRSPEGMSFDALNQNWKFCNGDYIAGGQRESSQLTSGARLVQVALRCYLAMPSRGGLGADMVLDELSARRWASGPASRALEL